MEMALVTIQRSSITGSPQDSTSDLAGLVEEESTAAVLRRNLNECYFAGKGAAVVLGSHEQYMSCNEGEQACVVSRDGMHDTNNTTSGCDIQQHLQSMFYLLRKEETLKMAVKLETARTGRTRYLVVVSRPVKCSRLSTSPASTTPNQTNNAQSTRQINSLGLGDKQTNLFHRSFGLTKLLKHTNNKTIKDQTVITQQHATITAALHKSVSESTVTTAENERDNRFDTDNREDLDSLNRNTNDMEESCLLGIDCNEKTTVGLVLRILADTTIRLDGDGGFSVSVFGRSHIFKPVSVQAMWSALQTLHKVSARARANNYYPNGPSHDWVSYYEDRIESERSCLNEWHTMDSIESRRPPSPDAVRNKPTQREETERVIRAALKEIMMSVDLDEVTSKYIRGRLEEYLDMDLGEFKSFIDQEMLIILGQMDAPTEIFDHLYLGSEWNASNLEELQKNGVHHILNVTREIDNFFPGMFEYCNIRVYDDEKTNLLKHWDNTFKYISRARKEGSKVLVHCKMGVSRSASVVIAYAMKAYSWNFSQALKHVKIKRNCIKPNKSFLSQLETYQGMLDAMKNKEKLQRSKSETNLRNVKDARLLPGSEPTPLIQALNAAQKLHLKNVFERSYHKKFETRPKSWSPDHVEASILLPKQHSQSLENLTPERKEEKTKNVRLPCSNGQNYSVSQNRVVHLQENYEDDTVPSVKLIVSELELNKEKLQHYRIKNPTTTTNEKLVKETTWDPGEAVNDPPDSDCLDSKSQNLVKNLNNICDSPTTWTSSAQINQKAPIIKSNKSNTTLDNNTTTTTITNPKEGDLFSTQVDRVFDREERKQHRQSTTIPLLEQQPPTQLSAQLISRQSSWSSVDSAVVVSYLGELRNKPSRHSSWGSGDDRTGPSRNSSFSSYDTRNNSITSSSSYLLKIHPEHHRGQGGILAYEKEDIPWHPGTVKRTKQKIEKSSIIKRLCGDNLSDQQLSSDKHTQPITSAIDISYPDKIRNSLLEHKKCKNRCNSEETLTRDYAINLTTQSINNRLSVSAPETSGCSLLLNNNKRSQLAGSRWTRNLKHQRSVDDPNSSNFQKNENIYGIVQNLKMNFEANDTTTAKENIKKVKSLPSSPVASHPSNRNLENNFVKFSKNRKNISEEINVKHLVDRYEVTKTKPQITPLISTITTTSSIAPLKPRPRSVFETRQHISNFSKPLMITHSTIIPKIDELRRPPVPPTVKNSLGTIPLASVLVAATANATASNPAPPLTKSVACKRMQQHGKTHPLSRLNLPKQRLNTAAYNTM